MKWATPPHRSVFSTRGKTRVRFAGRGRFLTQVIENRPCRVNQPILDYLNQAEASHGSPGPRRGWFWPGLNPSGSLLNTVTAEGTATAATLTWCVVPSISTGTIKSALLMGWTKGDRQSQRHVSSRPSLSKQSPLQAAGRCLSGPTDPRLLLNPLYHPP